MQYKYSSKLEAFNRMLFELTTFNFLVVITRQRFPNIQCTAASYKVNVMLTKGKRITNLLDFKTLHIFETCFLKYGSFLFPKT